MARPLRIQFPGAFYHVTCRGNEQRRIFRDDDDRRRFVSLLGESLMVYDVVLHAYVLMKNHFHFVVETNRSNLSEFMRHFNICYTGWFNNRYCRCGHLYQGRYKAILVDADSYLLEVSRYVHLNPVRTRERVDWEADRRLDFLGRYCWSSLPGYFDRRQAAAYVYHDRVLGMTGGRTAYYRFITDGLKEADDKLFEGVVGQVVLGTDDFVQRVRSGYVTDGPSREQPGYRGLMTESTDPKVLLRKMAVALGVEHDDFAVRRANSLVRGIAADLLYRYGGLKLRTIGQHLGGIDYTAVSMLRRRLKRRMVEDVSAQQKYLKAERALLSL